MGQFTALKTDGQLNQAIGQLLADMLEKKIIDAVLVPAKQAHKNVVMQTLIANPEHLAAIDPFAPVVTSSSAKMVSSLTYNPTGKKVGVVLRSCELRAFLELAKLKQGRRDDLMIIGLDCLGRFENSDYLALAEKDENLTLSFLKAAQNGGTEKAMGVALTNACQACEYPVADNVDLRLGLLGADPTQEIWLEGVSDKGKEALTTLGLSTQEESPKGRAEAAKALTEQRLAFKEKLFGEFQERTKDIEGLANEVAGCINCYNCRVACPVCYCKECVFVTDTFRHDSELYFKWADKKGRVKMPTDTVFYHLTRMIHMSTLCVGCGQCTSACPNGIPVMELFRTTAEKTQARFDYLPGRDLEEAQPLAIFHAEEYDDVTGQVK